VRAGLRQSDELDRHSRQIDSHQAPLPPLDQAERAAAASSKALSVDPTPWFCSKKCTAAVGNFNGYLNQHHLAATYATYLQNVR
jgi:hypothetical protein